MNILIVKTSAIGDVTHTLPALYALRRHWPQARIDWLVEEAASGLLVGHPSLDRLLISRRKSWIARLRGGPKRLSALRELIAFIGQLRRRRYDLVIDFQGLLKSGVLVGLSRSARKVGFGRGMDHAECSYIFLNERVPAVDMNIHAVDRELMLLAAIGVPCDEVVFDLPLSDDRYREVELLLRDRGIDDPRRVAPINPRTTWPTKLWDDGKFAHVGDWLAEQGLSVLFTGAPSDRRAVEAICRRMRQPSVNLAGETSLQTLAALYARAPLVVSTDSGPMHIAAAVNTPVIAVFGSTAPWRTGPYGAAHRIVRLDLTCSPCLKRTCPSHRCMVELPAQSVIDAARSVLDSSLISPRYS